ncbi:hypothetical protein FOZ62_003889, partial [Perkinsus olseni]
LVEDIGKKVEIALKNGSYNDEEIANLLRRDEKGVLFVKEEAFDYLPVLALRFGDATSSFLAKIPPEHYCVRYPETGELRPLVMYANASTREYPSILGTPFFRAYSVHVDYQDHSMALLENWRLSSDLTFEWVVIFSVLGSSTAGMIALLPVEYTDFALVVPCRSLQVAFFPHDNCTRDADTYV